MAKNGGTSKGRHKIEIKKIYRMRGCSSCVPLWLSKCKAGIFAKASDISTLCTGEEVAIVIYSPASAGNPYSFGSPSVEPLVGRFLSGSSQRHSTSGRSGTVAQLNEQFMEITKQLDITNSKKVKLDDQHGELALQNPELDWAKDVDKLELDQLKDGLERLKMRLDDRTKNYLRAAGGQRMSLPAGD